MCNINVTPRDTLGGLLLSCCFGLTAARVCCMAASSVLSCVELECGSDETRASTHVQPD
jgi:hypothetical protein